MLGLALLILAIIVVLFVLGFWVVKVLIWVALVVLVIAALAWLLRGL